MNSIIVFLVSTVCLATGKYVKPDALTGNHVRQLTEEQLRMMLGNAKAEESTDISQPGVFYFDPTKDECPGREYKIACPGERYKLRKNLHPVCVAESDLCDGKVDCPGGEDEYETACQYHILRRKQHISVIRELDEIESLRVELAKIRQSLNRKRESRNRSRPAHRRSRHPNRTTHRKISLPEISVV